MDRQIVFIGQIPQDTDVLLTNKDSYIALAKLCAGVLGISVLLNAFTCIPTSPASMQVNVTPGEIYSLQNIDNTAYGSLASDTAHAIMKQGIILNNTTLTLTAPGTVGNSWNVLIQIGFSETDGGSTVLPYYNASNPAVPWSGPSNSGSPNNTIRQDGVTIQAKIGVQAPTGTQVTPSPDTGFTGAFVVTIANGQTTIISGNISTYSGAPFITETLTQKISQATADLRYSQITAIQNGQYLYGVDTSVSANTITAPLSPVLGSYSAGMNVNIKIANTNTSTSTINLNSLGAKNITLTGGGAINAGDLIAGGVAELVYDGTNFELRNPASSVDFIPSNIQNSAYVYASCTTAANTYTASLSPAPASYGTGGLLALLKFTNSNTGAATINLNSLGAKNIKHLDGSALNSGDIAAGMIALLVYDGTNFQLLALNPANYITPTQQLDDASNYAASTTAANAYTATLTPVPTAYTPGMRVSILFTNANTAAASINLNGLGAKSIKRPDGTALKAGDIGANEMAVLLYDGTNFQFINPTAVIRSTIVQAFTSNGTYTPSPGMVYCIVEMVGGGGGSGAGAATGATTVNASGGGGGGGYTRGIYPSATIGVSQTVTIGAAGTAGAAVGGNGGTGGTSSLGAILSATGGTGGAGSGAAVCGSWVGGVGGTGASGTVVNTPGGPGGVGFSMYNTSVAFISGQGGCSEFSGGQNSLASPNVPNPGILYGGGASGHATGTSSSAQNGAIGAAGAMLITEYCTV